MGFPPDFLDELKTRVALVSVVGRRVRLTKKGREHSGLCPFHNEKSPSFTVNEDKGFFHCFGCGAHGDALGFEMRANHLSFTEAVEKLAQEVGLTVPQPDPEDRRRDQRRAGLHDAMEAACRHFEASLRTPQGREGLDYLKKRGLSDDTIARFRLGWATDRRDGLKAALMSDTLPESLLIEAGLLKKPDGPGASFDFFRGRVIFPVTDRRGRVIAFGARTLGDGQPKYLNSPDTPLFHKGATLYGQAMARETARAGNRVVAVEGYMDVIALHQAGFAFAVAPLGTALTEAQIEDMWRLADEPILCLDGDAAGQRAMARAADRALPILKPGKSLKIAVLPHPEDPDSLIRSQGKAAMQAILDQAAPLSDVVWRLTLAAHSLDTPERRALFETDLREKTRTIADETVRRQYQSSFRDRLFALERSLRPATGGTYGQAAGRPWKRKPGDPPLKGPDGRLPGIARPSLPQGRTLGNRGQERLLLLLILDHPPLLETVGENLGEAHFQDSTLDNLRRGILKHLDCARDLDSDALKGHLRSDGYSLVLDSLLHTSTYDIARPSLPHEAVALWQHTFTLYARKDLRADLAEAVRRLGDNPTGANMDRLEALKEREAGICGNLDDTK